MKVAVLSDFHFGFSYSLETENDSFENAEEAMEKALDCDLILIAGDIFDSRISIKY
jgi:DNA repair exonuclease SbcCD nuclease subunit